MGQYTPMFEITFEKSANLLKVSWGGHVGAGEAMRGAEKLESLLGDVPPGFRLLTDLSSLNVMDLECVPHIERIMDLFERGGVGMVVRVIPDPHKDIGLNIMSLFHYRRRIRIVTCKTLEEAEEALALRSV